MSKLYNLARMTSATTGTGTLTLGVAVSGYLTFANAGVQNGDVVYYGIKDGSSSEVGLGTYSSTGPTLARNNVLRSTNSNALISCSGSEEVYITALASDGGDLLPARFNPMRGFDMPINLQINASVASNALTIALKGNNGSDPGPYNPVIIPMRDTSGATSNTSPGNSGAPKWRVITSALSITVPSAQPLGTANNVPFRLWIVAIDNAGTIELAVFNSVVGGASPTQIVALPEHNLINTTAIASAPSGGVFYSTTARTSLPFRILGYVEYASGLATAGTYASAPTAVQLYGPGIPKPGEYTGNAAQVVTTSTTGQSASVANTWQAITGLSISFTLSSAMNGVEFSFTCPALIQTAGGNVRHGMFRGSTQVGPFLVPASTKRQPLVRVSTPPCRGGSTSPALLRRRLIR